jgi:hypothetical protein
VNCNGEKFLVPTEQLHNEKTNLSHLCKLSLDQNASWIHVSSISFYKRNDSSSSSLTCDIFTAYRHSSSFSCCKAWISSHCLLWYETRSRSYFSQHHTYFNHLLASAASLFFNQLLRCKEKEVNPNYRLLASNYFFITLGPFLVSSNSYPNFSIFARI